MATLEIDKIEYSTDAAARLAYVTSSSANLSAFSEATIKTQGNYSLKGVATTSASGALLTHVLPTASDLTGVDNLKFDLRSSRTGENIKLGLCYGSSALPSGGIISTDGGYTVHQFLSSGTFYTPQALSAEVLVVAGGGGGGSNYYVGAGGGAGGLIHLDSFAIGAGSFTTVVGSGGGISLNGANSSFSTLIASGGGGGGTYTSPLNGKPGGSGGGGSYTGTGGVGLSGQGTKGGNGFVGSGNCAGGGGGAGQAGANGTATQTGSGGNGLAFSITGTSKYYAGGGGGSFYTPDFPGTPSSPGGLGGGGDGSYGYGEPGEANTGGGGGGSERLVTTATGSGGSGIVVIRYLTPAVTTVSTITPNVVVADQFQTVNWNLKNIDNADKDLIECLKVEVVNADAANTFYLDNFEIAQAIDVVGVIE
jgi:hypothetical protein